jgi:membrane protease YdiL (CAAX protease family)
MNTLLNPNNHLFNLARTGQRLPHILVAVPLSFVIILVASIVGGIIAILINLSLVFLTGELTPAELDFSDSATMLTLIMPDTALEQVIFLVFSFGPIFLLLWLWLASFEKRPLSSTGMEQRGSGKKYLRGLGVGLLMFAASVGVSALLGYIAFEEGPPQQQGMAALAGVLLVFLGWTVQGPAEELITRGWLLPVIGARYKPWLGIILSSVIFAAFHGLNFIGLDISLPLIGLALLNLFLFGLFAALYTLYEGGLWGVFGIHAVWNWAQGNLFGFEVSGQAAAGGTLFNFMEIGPDVITGGPFGPEGGLAVTIVLIISCALVWWLAPTHQRIEEINV